MEKNKAIIDSLKTKGIELTDIDFSIVDVVDSLAEKTAIRVKKDYDGYVVEEVVGFVKSPQVEGLLTMFPAVSLYLFNTETDVGRMVEGYMRGGYTHVIHRYLNDEPYRKKILYDDLEEYRDAKFSYGKGYDDSLGSPRFKPLPSDQVRDELTEFSVRELKSIAQYNQFVDTYQKGRKIR